MSSTLLPVTKTTSLSSIDYDSLKRATEHGKEIMFYGSEHCYFYQIKMGLGDNVGKNFDWKLASSELCEQEPELDTSLLGRRLMKVLHLTGTGSAKGNRNIRTLLCKSALVNIVYENYHRSLNNIELIKVIFALDVNNNPFPLDPHDFCTREGAANGRITNKEVRRSYKLCTLPEELQEVSKIARETFVFVKVDDSDSRAKFERIDSIWNHPSWEGKWRERVSVKAERATEKIDWRSKLAQGARELQG